MNRTIQYCNYITAALCYAKLPSLQFTVFPEGLGTYHEEV